jgi:hypothetical protein
VIEHLSITNNAEPVKFCRILKKNTITQCDKKNVVMVVLFGNKKYVKTALLNADGAYNALIIRAQ